jgi:hypothetical protein
MILTGKPSAGPFGDSGFDEPLDDDPLVEPDQGSSEAPQLLTGMPWQAAASQQDGLVPDLQRHLSDNPPFDFHNDHEALGALMPSSPPLSPYQDASHPQKSGSKLGKLWQVMQSAAAGAAAGSAGGNFGQGFNLAQQASQNLQQLQVQRQAAKDLSDWRQAQIERSRQEAQGIPAKQAAMNAYRNARTRYVDQQTEKLKQAPSDKFIHSYNATDGKVHLVYQKASGDTYEKSSDAAFFVKPEAQPRPLLAHGHDHGVWLIDPNTGHARQVIKGRTDVPVRRGTPGQFATVEQWKNREWNRVQNDVMLSDADKMQRLQNVQDQFERVITTLGGEPAHYDVRSGSGQSNSQNDPNDPLGLFK